VLHCTRRCALHQYVNLDVEAPNDLYRPYRSSNSPPSFLDSFLMLPCLLA
jgi:hypothetical protein